jgi:hypothetical protein
MTPPCATEALLRHVELPHYLWEPCCGDGVGILDVLRAHGHAVIGSDLIEYGRPDCFWRRDFLLEWKAPDGCEGIVTNPPYKMARQFAVHALRLCPRVVMLMRLAFYESETAHTDPRGRRAQAHLRLPQAATHDAPRRVGRPQGQQRDGVCVVRLGPQPCGADDDRSNLVGAAMTAAYQASPIKRIRATKAEVEERREALLAIIDDGKPMTVRQVFYQTTVRGLVEKAESGYAKVQTDLTVMRRAGELPYDWLADNTRWQRKPRTFNGVEDALRATAAFYRKNLWADADSYVEIWLEKDALAGVVYPVTSMYDVPLMVARGYASLSFLYSAAEYIKTLDVPTYIYHFGDYDPSGVNAGEKIEETLREMAPDAEIVFERVAVTPEQIADWELPTRPTKTDDTRAKNFGLISVELDAIEPNQLRSLVQEVIEQHLPADQFEVLKAAEESERDIISRLVRTATKSRKG